MEMPDERLQIGLDLTKYPKLWKAVNRMIAEDEAETLTPISRPSFVIDLLIDEVKRRERKAARQARAAEGKK